MELFILCFQLTGLHKVWRSGSLSPSYRPPSGARSPDWASPSYPGSPLPYRRTSRAVKPLSLGGDGCPLGSVTSNSPCPSPISLESETERLNRWVQKTEINWITTTVCPGSNQAAAWKGSFQGSKGWRDTFSKSQSMAKIFMKIYHKNKNPVCVHKCYLLSKAQLSEQYGSSVTGVVLVWGINVDLICMKVPSEIITNSDQRLEDVMIFF